MISVDSIQMLQILLLELLMVLQQLTILGLGSQDLHFKLSPSIIQTQTNSGPLFMFQSYHVTEINYFKGSKLMKFSDLNVSILRSEHSWYIKQRCRSQFFSLFLKIEKCKINNWWIIGKSQCGGTAISNHKILTAAHCCINQYSVIAVFNDQIAGLTEVDEFAVESQERFQLSVSSNRISGLVWIRVKTIKGLCLSLWSFCGQRQLWHLYYHSGCRFIDEIEQCSMLGNSINRFKCKSWCSMLDCWLGIDTMEWQSANETAISWSQFDVSNLLSPTQERFIINSNNLWVINYDSVFIFIEQMKKLFK